LIAVPTQTRLPPSLRFSGISAEGEALLAAALGRKELGGLE
jgi:hypothetical protein